MNPSHDGADAPARHLVPEGCLIGPNGSPSIANTPDELLSFTPEGGQVVLFAYHREQGGVTLNLLPDQVRWLGRALAEPRETG